MIIYGLKTKDKFEFPVKVKELSDLEEKINHAYWCAFGMSSKGSNYSMEDFMKDKIKVKIEITKINQDSQKGRGRK